MAEILTQKQVTSNVSTRIEAMKTEGLLIAPNYSVNNALSSAYYALKNSSSGNLLEKCTQESVYNALLDMVVQGLSPAKTQCYFIPYGNNAKLMRSYHGTMKVVKQLTEVKDIWAEVVYEGDDFKMKNENGRKVFVSHDIDWQNQDNPIIGAYCIIEKTDGEKVLTFMTKKQIDVSWSKSKNKSVQKEFPDQMAMRTVINRAAKLFFNTSDDSDLFIEAVNNTTNNEYESEYDDDRQVKDITPDADTQDLVADLLDEPIEDAESQTESEPDPKDVTPSTEYPAEEIPDFDQETGEVLENSPELKENGELNLTYENPNAR